MLGGALVNRMLINLEAGPKGKKVVAVAPEWPGLARGAKTADAAIERLRAYVPRYAPVATLAGMDAAFSAISDIDIGERYTGTGSTDFWGISFGFSSFDQQALSSEELERELTLTRACWMFFDEVRARVSAEMERGPRGGGRDRDRIVRHTLFSETDFAKKLGLKISPDVLLTDDGLSEYRDTYLTTIREFHAQEKMARTWPLRFLIRHTAYHTLDHAWEMEDKDLSTRGA